MYFKPTKTTLLLGMLVSLLGACGSPSGGLPTSTVDVASLQTAAVGTFVAGLTAAVPTATETPPPTSTPTQTGTPLPPTSTFTATPTDVLFNVLNAVEEAEYLPTHIAFYVISPISAPECTYYMRPVIAAPYPLKTGDVIVDVTAALTALFRFNFSEPGGFPNPMLPASLQVTGVTREGGSMTVHLTGNPARTDDKCTNRQMRDQLVTTIHRIANGFGIYDIVIWLDTNLYDDYMIGE